MSRQDVMFALVDKLMEAYALAVTADLKLIQSMLDMVLLDLTKYVFGIASPDLGLEDTISDQSFWWLN